MFDIHDEERLNRLRLQIAAAGPKERAALFFQIDQVLSGRGSRRTQMPHGIIEEDTSEDFFDNMPV